MEIVDEQTEEKELTFKENFKIALDEKMKEKRRARALKTGVDNINYEFYRFIFEKCSERCILNFDNKLLDVKEIQCLTECSNHIKEVSTAYNSTNCFHVFNTPPAML